MIVYISGPMTGIEEFNYPLFNSTAKTLREQGHEVINPAEITPLEATWNGFMRADIKALMDADTVLLLPGWEKSNGANAEFYLAELLDMKIYKFESDIELNGALEWNEVV
ncbi:DUF4406 domain-containing protein [Paenibacillus macquariensis]|uniref:Nucleoside 2-deoxyribosyltransferase n=1 Tax=Paenibacillus macquariensis TaxID=948756 RepID=A0ABY1KEU2_9BACL|nr:DUF4406 domain-containing protein [Paenibacillus macquariensis]MEC0092482.1 DUF4406 domain-containing protein [Paenibacillus macquariensis]SIR72595.1 protein of unknown function [Paenibacillus macquariensis]